MGELAMLEPATLSTLEFLTWLDSRPRTYAEAMEAWSSRCSRNSVWEDALTEGLIQVESAETMGQSKVILTPQGRVVLDGKSRSHVDYSDRRKKRGGNWYG